MNELAFLSVEGMRVALGERTVLDGVSFAVARGRMAALVGPNGAGKTTLLRALMGLVPMDGVVRVDGEVIAALPIHARARRFAYLPQGQSVHWPLPVRDVVALGRYPHGAVDPSNLAVRDVAAVARAMTATEVVGFAERPVNELSGGERSRVLLARVLAVEAPVVLADEPTASLDPRHQIEVMRVLQAAARGGAVVIVVTHDLGLAARFADVAVVMKDGRIVADGAPEKAFTPTVLADVFRVSAFRAECGGESVLVPWTTE